MDDYKLANKPQNNQQIGKLQLYTKIIIIIISNITLAIKSIKKKGAIISWAVTITKLSSCQHNFSSYQLTKLFDIFVGRADAVLVNLKNKF